MRIAVWHNLPSGGGKRALFDHVKGLLDRGHYLEAWAPPSIDDDFLPLGQLIQQHIVPLTQKNRPTLMDRLGVTLATKTSIDAMDKHCEKCAKQIENGGFDLLFASSCRAFRTTSIGRSCQIPSVLYLQEPYRWLYEAMPNPPWAALPEAAQLSVRDLKLRFKDWRDHRNARVQVREEVRNAKAYDMILCNSYFSRESILRAYGASAEVCYLGTNPIKLPEKRERGSYVVGLGALTREKNVDLCIRAVALTSPRLKLMWIGNTSDKTYLTQMVQLAKELDVDFTPKINISDQEVSRLLFEALVMIYVPRLEPFGLAPIEAGRHGLPVVAVAEGGVRETVIDLLNGLLVDDNATALSSALNVLFQKPEFAERLGRQGRLHAEKYWSHEAGIDRLEEKFSNILKQVSVDEKKRQGV